MVLRGLVSGGVLACVVALFLAVSPAHAQDQAPTRHPPLPRISEPRAQFFAAHPDALTQFQSQLASRPAGAVQPSAQSLQPPGAAAGGTWHAVTTAPADSLCNPLLLTDGSIMVAECNTPRWYKLSPDSAGNYADGTWSRLASLPAINGTQYQPQYYASAVLPDGRVIIMGGEYNGSSTEVWTDLGAIYDPVADSWTPVAAPAGSGWSKIGDAQGVVLANGTFLLGSCCANPAVDALFNASTSSWTSTGAPSAGGNYQDEQGYTLLPNKMVLTLDIWTNYAAGGNAKNAERYKAGTGVWVGGGKTPVSLVDPYSCGNFEIGPAVLRGDGTVVAFGGHTCGAAADPTAIYSVSGNSWSAGPNVPALCGPFGNRNCDLADAPAALLPNGNILFAASAGFGTNPTHFFEFTAGNTIQQVADPLFNADSSAAFYYNFLVLPNGQIFMTDFSNVPELYTPVTGTVAAWAPSVTKFPLSVTRGTAYKLNGVQLNGVSAGAYYGDDIQAATNYPIVRITNNATGHVVYARTANHSSMTVTPNATGFTFVTVPASAETGASSLVVIANGIASAPVGVTIK